MGTAQEAAVSEWTWKAHRQAPVQLACGMKVYLDIQGLVKKHLRGFGLQSLCLIDSSFLSPFPTSTTF